MYVVKRDGSVVEFSDDKIRKGLEKSSNRSRKELSTRDIDNIITFVKSNYRR